MAITKEERDGWAYDLVIREGWFPCAVVEVNASRGISALNSVVRISSVVGCGAGGAVEERKTDGDAANGSPRSNEVMAKRRHLPNLIV